MAPYWHHLDPRAVAHHLFPLLDGADAPDLHPHCGVELERGAPGGGQVGTISDADLLARLVMNNTLVPVW
jgi:hypothetical protein